MWEHPEWRAELRELSLTEELVALPCAFAEARASYAARFERIERALAQLTERMDALTQNVDKLALAQASTEATLKQVIFTLDQFAERQDKLIAKQGEMLGALLERRYTDRAPGYPEKASRQRQAPCYKIFLSS